MVHKVKPVVVESRYDFRGGRNTAITSDLLNPNELVDATNCRLTANYGGFSKRTGTQKIHQTGLGSRIDGLTQWDGPSGKQIVAISGGKLWYRNGFDYPTAFTSVTPTGTIKKNSDNGGNYNWTDTSGSNDGLDQLTRSTNGTSVSTGGLVVQMGVPAGTDDLANDDLYVMDSFSITADGTSLTGTYALITVTLTFEWSADGSTNWTPITPTGGPFIVDAGIGFSDTATFTGVTFTIDSATNVFIRCIHTFSITGSGSYGGSATGTVSMKNGSNRTDVQWVLTGGSLGGNVFFMPFRDPALNGALSLYFSSGGHLWKWIGSGSTITQLDPTNSTPTASMVISYHTRAFATTAGQPKTLFWSKIGDPTVWSTGAKDMGGFAITDFLTQNALVSLETLGSSLAMATAGSVMRFTGHSSDDIVIAQDTEGISAEVGCVGAYALKRFENVAAMLSERGPYVVTETHVEPIGEQLANDWYTLDTVNINKSSVNYHRGRKELWVAVPRTTDSSQCKSIFVQSARLGAWQGPWTYSFGITSLAQYVDAQGIPNLISGGEDGFIRLMDFQAGGSTKVLDDVLYDGTGGTAIAMTVEFPILHFGIPGLMKQLNHLLLQAELPTSSAFKVKISTDGAAFTDHAITGLGSGVREYKRDILSSISQGYRTRMQFVDASDHMVAVNGWTLVGWNYGRTP